MTPELLRLIAAQVCLHAAMTGTRLAAPLLALQQGYSAAAVGVLLALFALTQVFLALPAGRFADRHGLRRPMALSVIAASLGAVKTEFNRFGEWVERIKEQVARASDTIDKADTRQKQMRRALKSVEALPDAQAQALLPAVDPDDDLAA